LGNFLVGAEASLLMMSRRRGAVVILMTRRCFEAILLPTAPESKYA